MRLIWRVNETIPFAHLDLSGRGSHLPASGDNLIKLPLRGMRMIRPIRRSWRQTDNFDFERTLIRGRILAIVAPHRPHNVLAEQVETTLWRLALAHWNCGKIYFVHRS